MAKQPQLQNLINPLGIEAAFQEEGPGLGPSSDLIRKFNQIRARYADPKYTTNDSFFLPSLKSRGYDINEIIKKGIADATEFDEKVREKELSGIFGFGSPVKDALRQIKENQKTDLFKSPEEDLSALARRQLNKKFAEEIGNMPSDSPALQMSGLDQIAEELNRAEIPISGPKADELVRNEEKIKKDAEDFRAEEEKIAKMTGGDPVIGETKTGDIQSALDNSFSEAMNDYINAVRGAAPEDKERTLDEYKAEFAKATGVDVSGKVDKSSALMALGLALMQNRAGSGFNVGKILREVGAAGEKALPALEKAKEKAQSAAIAAGKYALETRASDRAKDEAADLANKKRGKYWVYRKGGKGTEFSKFDEGEFVDLNPFELNKLIENKDFDKEYEFIDASDRMSILEKRAEGVDLGDMWDDYKAVSLIGGSADDVPPELQIFAAAADPNYKGLTPSQYKLGETPETIVRRFTSYQAGLNRSEANMKELVELMQQGVTIPDQIFDKIGTFARNLGIQVGDGPMSTTKARTLLKEISVRQATNILQESGKTLSDRDRKLVDELVGEIDFASADKDLILGKIKKIYYLTVEKPQENLNEAITWLQDNAGISFNRQNYGDAPATEEDLAAFNEATGNNFTMEDFK